MIFGILTGLVGGIIKRVISMIIFVIVFVWAIFNLDTIKGWIDTVKDFADSDVKIDVKTDDGNFSISVNAKKQIDAWLVANKLNIYGDKEGTMYAGGTPLFNEATGESLDRYEYLLKKYPELKNIK